MRSRPAAALAPRSADVEALPQAPESLPHVLAESPRVQMKVTHNIIIDSSATALSRSLSHTFSLSHSLCGWSRESRAASPGLRRLDAGALKLLTTAAYQQSIYIQRRRVNYT